MTIQPFQNFFRFLNTTSFVVLILLWFQQAQSQDMPFDWTKQAGGTNFEEGNRIATDGSGNIYVIGNFWGTATFGSTTFTSSGFDDIFIAKLDASGNFLWAKQAGGFDSDEGLGITVDGSGNVFVTGYFYTTATFGSTTLTSVGHSAVFIAKLNASGNFLWAKQGGGSGQNFGYDIALDGSGNIYVIGDFSNTATFGSTTFTSTGGMDLFIAKLNASGNFVWAKQAGGLDGLDYVHGHAIAVDGSGKIFLTGHFTGTAMYGSTTLNSNPDGYGDSSIDIFIAKLDASGNFLWAKQAGGSDDDLVGGIAVDGSGNVFVTGYFWSASTFGTTTLTSSGSGDIYIVKLDASGNFLWAKQAGGTSGDDGRGIAVDGSGNSFVTGYFNGTATFGSTILTSVGSSAVFIAKLNASGNFLRAKQAGGSEGAVGSGIAVDGSGNVFVTGYFYGTSTFGSTTLTSAGYQDVFVTKLKPVTVDVTYDVRVPSNTPVSDIVYIMGWFNDWDPGPSGGGDHDLPMTKIGNNHWQITLQLPPGEHMHYRYTRGSYETISAGAQGEEIPEFSMNIPHNATIEIDTVLSWMDMPPVQTTDVTFRAAVPSNTPVSDIVYIAGTFNSWDPGPSQNGVDGLNHDLPMTKTGTNQWEIGLPLTAGQAIEYKYTRGSWAKVEAGSQGEVIPNRTFTVPGSDCYVNDTVLKWTDLTSVDSDRAGTVTEFRLCANYPNPFNPRTTIRFELPQTSRVSLKVIDCLGREQAVLVDGEMSPGVYEVPFENKTLDSGIFIYTLTVQDRDSQVVYHETRKGLMLK
jgi:hypothetical protein